MILILRRSVFVMFLLSLGSLSTGCDSSDPEGVIDPVVVEFDFDSESAGWEAGFVDYPEGREADVEFTGDHRQLPDPLGPSEALYHRGFNISDDLFMYFKHRVGGLAPNTQYEATFQLGIASDYGEDCTIGVGAGVYVKAGVSSVEPEGVVDSEGLVRLNVDKGQQQNDGANALLIGDIRNGEPGCGEQVPYAIETVDSGDRSLTTESDDEGMVWVFFGTESAFESPHEVFFTELHVRFD